MRRAAFVVLVALLAAACSSSVCCPRATPCSEAVRRFVVLRPTPVADPQGGPSQVFIDVSVVAVPVSGRIQALEESARIDSKPAPVWLAGTQLPDASFGAGVRVVAAPKLLAIDGQEATVFVGEHNKDGTIHSGWHLRVTPMIRSDQVHMTVAYRHHEGGRLVDSVPATPLEGPVGRVFIIESRPN